MEGIDGNMTGGKTMQTDKSRSLMFREDTIVAEDGSSSVTSSAIAITHTTMPSPTLNERSILAANNNTRTIMTSSSFSTVMGRKGVKAREGVSWVAEESLNISEKSVDTIDREVRSISSPMIRRRKEGEELMVVSDALDLMQELQRQQQQHQQHQQQHQQHHQQQKRSAMNNTSSSSPPQNHTSPVRHFANTLHYLILPYTSLYYLTVNNLMVSSFLSCFASPYLHIHNSLLQESVSSSSSRPSVNLWKKHETTNSMLSTIVEHTSTLPITPISSSRTTSPDIIFDHVHVDDMIPIRLDPTVPSITSPSSRSTTSSHRRLPLGMEIMPQSNLTAASSQISQTNLSTTLTNHRPDLINQRLLTSFRQRRHEMFQANGYDHHSDEHSNRDPTIPIHAQVTPPSSPFFPSRLIIPTLMANFRPLSALDTQSHSLTYTNTRISALDTQSLPLIYIHTFLTYLSPPLPP